MKMKTSLHRHFHPSSSSPPDPLPHLIAPLPSLLYPSLRFLFYLHSFLHLHSSPVHTSPRSLLSSPTPNTSFLTCPFTLQLLPAIFYLLPFCISLSPPLSLLTHLTEPPSNPPILLHISRTSPCHASSPSIQYNNLHTSHFHHPFYPLLRYLHLRLLCPPSHVTTPGWENPLKSKR